MRATFALTAGLAIALASPPEAAAQSSNAPAKPLELIDRYDAFLHHLNTIRYDYTDMVYEKGGPFADWTWTCANKCLYARNGDRWRVRTREIGFNFYDKKRIPFDLEGEATFDGRTYMSVNRDHRDVRNLADMTAEQALARLAANGGGVVETNVVAEVDAIKPVGATEYSRKGPTFSVYGYIPNDGLYVLDLLRDSKSRLSVSSDVIDGRQCDVIKAASTHGIVTLWLDPNAEFAPLRLSVRKSGNDLMGKTQMRKLKADGDDKLPTPNQPMRELELEVDFRPERVVSQWVIASFVRKTRFIYADGSDYSRRTVASLANIRAEPSPGELQPTIAIPDGNTVHIRNAPEMQAKWAGGKLVMGYDKPTVAALDATWVSEPPPSPWQRPFVLATTVFLAVAACAFAWRIIKKGAA